MRRPDTYALFARIHKALGQRFRAPEWALLHEVCNGTGSRARRSADAIAINLWPSRGLELHGIEVKVTRSDWLRELRNPEKSAPVQKYCDRWWIAAPPDVVQTGELPVTWGLLLLRKRGLVAKKQAPPLDPAPLDRAFVAAIGRRMHECVERARDTARAELGGQDEYERGVAAGKEEAATADAVALKRVTRAHDELLADVKRFEEASGLRINGYNGEHLGSGVRAYLRLQSSLSRGSIELQMDTFAHRLRELANTVDACRKGLGLDACREGLGSALEALSEETG